jgi:branched-subunit amino acid ABC-type transport system permease component
MTQYVVFAIIGVGTGSIISLLGLSVVLGYRGSGIINFSAGACATYVAYIFNALRTEGEYATPFGKVKIADQLGLWPALLLAVLTAVVLGLLLHLLVFGRLQHAPPIAKVVASVGVTLALESVVVLQFGDNAQYVPPVLPSDSRSFKVLGFYVPDNRMYLLGVVIVVAIVLASVFRFTRAGLAMRASSENQKGAILLGFSPNSQGALTWVLATTLAGIAGVLLAPLVPLSPESFTLLIVPAMTAALVGSFSSFALTVSAGIVIGIAESLIQRAESVYSWIPTGVEVALPLVVLVIVLFIRGSAIPLRGDVIRARLPFVPRQRHPLATSVVTLALGIVVIFAIGSGYRLALINSLIATLICLSLVVITGYLGQISLAQIALAGASGFILSRMSTNWGIPFPFSMIAAAVFAAVIGLLVALPALRIRGTQLAVVSLAAAVAITSVYFENASLTGAGIVSAQTVPSAKIFGLNLGISGSDFPRPAFAIFLLVIVVLAALGVAALRGSSLGRRMLAVRSDEVAAAASGVNVSAVKLIGFGISAVIAGLGGAMLGYARSELTPDSFTVTLSLVYFAFAYLGGITTIFGTVLGGLLATGGVVFLALDNAFGLGQYQDLIGGLGLVVTAVLNPEGISGALRQVAAVIRSRIAVSALDAWRKEHSLARKEDSPV